MKTLSSLKVGDRFTGVNVPSARNNGPFEYMAYHPRAGVILATPTGSVFSVEPHLVERVEVVLHDERYELGRRLSDLAASGDFRGVIVGEREMGLLTSHSPEGAEALGITTPLGTTLTGATKKGLLELNGLPVYLVMKLSEFVPLPKVDENVVSVVDTADNSR